MIRFIKVNNSTYYSINDIAKLLKAKKVISSQNNIASKFRKMMSRKNLESVQSNLYNPVGSAPMDEFYSWVAFQSVYSLLSAEEIEKVKQTRLLQFIDLNDLETKDPVFQEFQSMIQEYKLDLQPV